LENQQTKNSYLKIGEKERVSCKKERCKLVEKRVALERKRDTTVVVTMVVAGGSGE
jgi:hypothetical protein